MEFRHVVLLHNASATSDEPPPKTFNKFDTVYANSRGGDISFCQLPCDINQFPLPPGPLAIDGLHERFWGGLSADVAMCRCLNLQLLQTLAPCLDPLTFPLAPPFPLFASFLDVPVH